MFGYCREPSRGGGGGGGKQHASKLRCKAWEPDQTAYFDSFQELENVA